MKRIWMTVLFLVIFLSACDGSSAIWQRSVKSPDGSLVATASTTQNAGFGSGYVDTSVYLAQATDSRKPVLVLGFVNASAYPRGVTAVRMNWVSPTHFDVIYSTGATIDFQAIRAFGTDITVHFVKQPAIALYPGHVPNNSFKPKPLRGSA